MDVASIFLTSSVQVLLEKLASGVLLNFARRERIDTQLTKWKGMLEQINAVLADAEQKQMTDQSGGIKLWLESLEDLAYDLDDVLDKFDTEVLRRKVMEEPQASTSRVRALLPTCCTSFDPSTLLSDFGMSSQIDEITTRLQGLFNLRTGLGLQTPGVGPSPQSEQRRLTSSLIHEPRLYGRDEDEKKILELLLSDQLSTSNFDVVPIVGMGGVGKTALAQMVYNNKTVKEHFEMKAWVCVSDVFDIMEITKQIFRYVVTSKYCDFKTLDQVQVQLKEALAGKKFLIVLDDVWNNNHGDWSILKSPFNDGAQGSKVIVTTRNMDVALMMVRSTDKCHSLKELSEGACWSVFEQHAFENRIIDENSNLVSIGREIVKKCRGLPLAARTLGGLLRCKSTDDEWDEVLNSKIWESPIKRSDILPALRLSYHHLPSHLKKCFAYCSVLHKDYEFEEKELVFLWMAEGLIQKPTGQKQMEDLGSEYFRELLSRSFFQPSSSGTDSRFFMASSSDDVSRFVMPSSSGDVTRFVMHDLINDLAQFVAREICFRLEDKLEDNDNGEKIAKARYLSYTRGDRDGITRFKAFHYAKNLRTFLPLASRHRDYNGTTYHLTNDVPLCLLPSLKRLRVLSLGMYEIDELSSSIGDLKHIRYLDLSCARIAMLPESVGTLYNLQTLILRNCGRLKKLPANTGNLINLRHLDVTGAYSLQEMPPKMGKLTSLQTLSEFIVSKGTDGSKINELGKLIHLQGTICISGLENVADALDARGANLKDKKGLDVLLMTWSYILDDSRDGIVELNVLDMLKPHENLQGLILSGYHGLTFPTWVGNSSFSRIACLTLQHCEKCTLLPPLGQLPKLAKLYIRNMKAVENVGLEFYGLRCSNPFPSLETLCFEDMPEWKDWYPFGVKEGTQAFAHLSELSIEKCPKLLGILPSNLPSLTKLVIEECPLLVVASVPSPIELNEVWNALHFDSLTNLSLSDVSIPDSFHNPENADHEAVLGNARFSHWSSLTSLTIQNIQGLTCLPSLFFQGPTRLQHHHLPDLKRLVIWGCSQLISLFEEDEEDEVEGPQQHEVVPYLMTLEHLKIARCVKLEKLPQGLHNLKSLQQLFIEYCPCLISFPNTGLPSTLRELSIRSCNALRSLPELMLLNSLEKLEISACSSVTYLSSSPTLKHLEIQYCEKLEAILAEEGTEINCPALESISIFSCNGLKSLPNAMQNNDGCLGNLTRLNISSCDNLESIPKGWFAATNLRQLRITNCNKLEGQPLCACNNNNRNHLTSLQTLSLDRIARATKLLSCILKEASNLSSCYFTNLVSLELNNVDVGKPPPEWDFRRLSSLRELKLESYGCTSFPENGITWLPPSLIQLTIDDFPNLEKLSCKEFQNLLSLEELTINDCPKLTSITELGHLSSLSTFVIRGCPNLLTSFAEQRLPPSILVLHIWGCEKLTSIPNLGQLSSLSSLDIRGCPNLLASFAKQGLPPSLLYLIIWGCPKLEKAFEKGKGRYWRHICNIPFVGIFD